MAPAPNTETQNEVNTIQDDLKKLSRQIQEYEKSYLEDTMYYGNVVIGWSEEGFQKAEKDKTAKKVVDIDPELKIFSREKPFESDKDQEDERPDSPEEKENGPRKLRNRN